MFLFIRCLFKKKRKYSTLFSEAVAEGFRETLKEMGYQFPGNDDKAEVK